jgi:hypothetical protein
MKRRKIVSRQTKGVSMVNRQLKAAAVLEFGSQVEAAKALGWSESRARKDTD